MLLMCTYMQAQTQVERFEPGITAEGVKYFLPQTALRVTVVAEKTVTTPGELNKYAFRYMRIQDAPTTESTVWKIKDIMLEPYGVPDKSKAFSVKVNNKTLAPLVSLTHDGILLSVNAETEEVGLQPLPEEVVAPAPLNPKQYMSQEILSAGSTLKMAELCAQEIYDIRESRNALVRGEADNTPKDGEQLRLMLERLDTQEEALTQIFCGSTQTSTKVFTINYLPSEETEKDILFRVSQLGGVVDKDDLSGYPVYISVKNAGNLPPRTETEEGKKGSFFNNLFKKSGGEKGIVVNVPARESVIVFDVNQTLLQTECTMGQFGYTELLSSVLFDKKQTTKVTFYQENGGVKKVEQ